MTGFELRTSGVGSDHSANCPIEIRLGSICHLTKQADTASLTTKSAAYHGPHVECTGQALRFLEKYNIFQANNVFNWYISKYQ